MLTSDAFTFVAQTASAGNLKLRVSFRVRGGTTTDPSDQRDTWGCELVSATGQILAEWTGFEKRDEMFETAARALAATAAKQIQTIDAQLQARNQALRQKASESKAKEATAEAAARKVAIEKAVRKVLREKSKRAKKAPSQADAKAARGAQPK